MSNNRSLSVAFLSSRFCSQHNNQLVLAEWIEARASGGRVKGFVHWVEGSKAVEALLCI